MVRASVRMFRMPGCPSIVGRVFGIDNTVVSSFVSAEIRAGKMKYRNIPYNHSSRHEGKVSFPKVTPSTPEHWSAWLSGSCVPSELPTIFVLVKLLHGVDKSL